jgi:hypothetical protein
MNMGGPRRSSTGYKRKQRKMDRAAGLEGREAVEMGMMPKKKPMKRPNATSPRPRMRPEAEVDVSPKAEQGDIELMMKEKMNRGSGMNMAYGGKVKKMRKGGKVRGAGMARKGVRACKMR